MEIDVLYFVSGDICDVLLSPSFVSVLYILYSYSCVRYFYSSLKNGISLIIWDFQQKIWLYATE